MQSHTLSINSKHKNVSKFKLYNKNFLLQGEKGYHAYVGANNNWACLNSPVAQTLYFNNYSEVVDYIEQNNNRLGFVMPLSITIDLPLEFTALEILHIALRRNHNLSNVPVIYNQQLLKSNQIKLLKGLGLVDHIIDINTAHVPIKSHQQIKKSTNLEKLFHILRQKKQLVKRYISEGSLFCKTLLDSLIALTALIVLTPFFLLIAIAIRLESRGPVFYSSPRAGRGYKVFKFYKFRSMVVDADNKIEELANLNQYTVNDNGPKFIKIDNDPRVTKVGRFLRNTSLDELPQLFNVLKGDMSIVGNRPLPLYEAETLTTDKYVERFMAPAGITGLWQVKKRGKADMSIEERIELDIAYARGISPILDIKILVKTPFALVQKNNV